MPCTAIAQPGSLQLDRLSIEQGLSQATISCIHQDHRGFMWFGTQDGLNRFDGYAVTVFRNDPLDSASLGDNSITAIHEDRSGALWIGTPQGLNRFNGGDETFTRIPLDRSDAARPLGTGVYAIAEDARGTLWIGTGGGLARFDRTARVFRPLAADAILPADVQDGLVRNIVIDAAGIVWAGIDGHGVLRLDPAARSWHLYQLVDDANAADLASGITALTIDRAGRVWAGNMNGLHLFDPAAGVFRLFHVRAPGPGHPPFDLVASICEDRRGLFWISTAGNGLFTFDRATHAVTAYPSDPVQTSGLPTMFLTSLFCDRSGDLWIGTNGNGVLHLDRRRAMFPRFRIDRTLSGGAPINHINAFCETRSGDIWIGCRNHVAVYGGDLSLKRVFRTEQFAAHGLTTFSIRAIMEDRAGTIWLATGGGGLFAYDTRRTRFRRFINAAGRSIEHGDNFFFAMHEDRDGMFWLAAGSGLFRFDRVEGRFLPLFAPGSATPVIRGTVWSIFEDHVGRLWLGTGRQGAVFRDRGRARAARYPHAPANRHSLSSNAVTSVFEDRAGHFWITTTNGLNRLDDPNGRCAIFTTRSGLPNNSIYGILEDGSGNLWMSSNLGIARMNPATAAFRNYDMQNGLQSNEYNQGAYLRCRDGRLLFGGVDGFNAFRPTDIVDDALPPPVVLTGCRIHGVPVHFDRSIADIPSLTFSHSQNSFAFDFVAINFSDPAKTRYAYMLEGYDRTWVQAGGRRSASYMNLDGGSYVFRVKAANGNGVWNDIGASIRVVVIPPPWKTWWAYALYVLLLASAVYAVIRIRERRVVALERLRSGIAADLHDEIGSSLTRISLHAELIQQGIEAPQMERYLAQIADTSREVVRSMSDVVWSIDARNDTVGSLVDRMRDFAAALFSDERYEVAFEVSGLDPKRALAVSVRQNVYLIFKEALNNIVRHADARRVAISLGNGARGFRMEIANDGASKDAPTRRSGHGLRNMAMRAERIGGTLETSFDHGGRVVLITKAL